MRKVFIVEDSSFVVALMNSTDSSHRRAFLIFKKLLRYSEKIRIVIPTPVIYESLFALIRNRISAKVAQEKLWRLLMVRDVLNVSILETTAIRIAPKVEPCIFALSKEASIPANDLIVIAVAMEYDNAPILTFDRSMKKRFEAICPNIFYVLDETEEKKFFETLDNEIC